MAFPFISTARAAAICRPLKQMKKRAFFVLFFHFFCFRPILLRGTGLSFSPGTKFCGGS